MGTATGGHGEYEDIFSSLDDILNLSDYDVNGGALQSCEEVMDNHNVKKQRRKALSVQVGDLSDSMALEEGDVVVVDLGVSEPQRDGTAVAFDDTTGGFMDRESSQETVNLDLTLAHITKDTHNVQKRRREAESSGAADDDGEPDWNALVTSPYIRFK